MQTDYGSSSISKYVVNKWIQSGLYEQYLTQVRENLKQRRDYTVNLLHTYFSDFATWDTPSGGFYLGLHLKSGISTRKLFDAALQEGILLNPGSVYVKHDQEHLRLSYSYASLEDLEHGIKLLSELVKKIS